MSQEDNETLTYDFEHFAQLLPTMTAQVLTSEIHEVSVRMNELMPAVGSLSPTEYEGWYVEKEYDRLKQRWDELNDQYTQLHRLNVRQAASLQRLHPSLGNIPD